MSSSYNVTPSSCSPDPLAPTPAHETSAKYVADFKKTFGYHVLKHDDPNELVLMLTNINGKRRCGRGNDDGKLR